MKRLLLIGAGRAHLDVLCDFSRRPLANAMVTLVTPAVHTPCPGMLAGIVAGHYSRARSYVDLDDLARRAETALLPRRVAMLDVRNRIATFDSGEEVGFDIASINIGAQPFMPAAPGLREFALLAKPHEIFLQGWERIRELAGEGAVRRFTVVGGGVAAVELMLAMRHRLKSDLGPGQFARCGFSIVTDAARLLAERPSGLSETVERICAQHGISLLRGAAVTAVEREAVVLANGARLSSDITVWAADARPAGWPARAGLACDAQGFLLVGDTLRAVNHPNVFGAGACASAQATNHLYGPASGWQGTLLATNLRNTLAQVALQPPGPGAVAPMLISLGGKQALSFFGGHVTKAPRWLMWRWKDLLDRRRARSFRA